MKPTLTIAMSVLAVFLFIQHVGAIGDPSMEKKYWGSSLCQNGMLIIYTFYENMSQTRAVGVYEYFAGATEDSKVYHAAEFIQDTDNDFINGTIDLDNDGSPDMTFGSEDHEGFHEALNQLCINEIPEKEVTF